MLPDYSDITRRIATAPRWYDDSGVPRYDPFHPRMLGVYDQVAVLLRIGCQSCGRGFDVGLGYRHIEVVMHGDVVERSTEEIVAAASFGDPPRHDYGEMGRCAGETMSSIEVAITEVWEKVDCEWARRADLEGAVPGSCVQDGSPGWGAGKSSGNAW